MDSSAQMSANASTGPPMWSTTWASETPPTTCVTGPDSTQTHSHVVPRANKAPEGPLPVQGRGVSQLVTTSRAPRRPPASTPHARSSSSYPTKKKAHDSEDYLQDCHDRPADFSASPSPPAAFSSGGYSNGRTNCVNLNFETEIDLKQLPVFANQARCHRIGSARI